MLERNQYNNDGLSNFVTVIKAAMGFLKTKIISSELDQTGIVLYNCNQTQNYLNFEGIYVLDKLDRPNAETIKQLESLIDIDKNKFGASKSEVSLADVLWTCQQQFKALDISSFTKRIFVFTNEENPMEGMHKEIEESIERGRNLRDEDIEIELFPMPHPYLDK